MIPRMPTPLEAGSAGFARVSFALRSAYSRVLIPAVALLLTTAPLWAQEKKEEETFQRAPSTKHEGIAAGVAIVLIIVIGVASFISSKRSHRD